MGLLETALGKWLINQLIRYIGDHVIAFIERWREGLAAKKKAEKIDQNYEPVKSGELSNEEEIKRTEDTLSGRLPSP